LIMKKATEHGTRIIGPNTPGILSAGKCKMGVMPSHIFSEGSVGLISRSGTLTYEIVDALTRSGLGQTTTVGLGGDPIVGLGFIELLDLFEKDVDTKAVVMVGEIGGSAEERAALHIKESITKPVVAYIAGRTAPPGKTMGHAGAIISGSSGTAQAKIEALQTAGIKIAEKPGEIPGLIKESI
jgi:succinyl-CoA synthetase alpha subunit